ncbi:unnamed protein product, partial [Effrenium voratum]
EEWPEYKDCALMLSRPAYQASRRLQPEEWTRQYLAEDVEQLQRRKQHHVHLPAGPGGERRPLAHCRDFKDPTRCKSGFPRDSQLILGRTALVCHGLAEQLDLPVKGKRSSLGLQWGPVNDPNLNGNHPALLAALETHDDALCQEEACVGDGDVKLLVREAQRNQAAQAGYGCDYMNKRLPIAAHELKEWQKGQQELGEELKDKPAGYVGARVAKRLTTDCYARGVSRGAVECANLTTRAVANDPTAAESVKTATVHSISLRFGFQLLDAAAAGRVVSCPFWTFYGARGRAAQVYELCAFEFARHFRFQQAKRPFTLAPMTGELSGYHAALTDAGAAKLDRSARANLQPGVDYKIREEGGEDWLPLGRGALAQKFRHDWVLAPRSRPHVPVVQGALGGRSEVDYARCVLLLFCPWTTHPDDASAAVPYLGDLCKLGETDWRRALRRRLILRGFPTEEVKLFALNFCFVYCLPRELRPDQHLQENSDNEVQDEPVFFDEADLEAARATHVRGAGKLGSGDAGENGEEDGEVEDEAAATRLCVMTKQMFDLSRAAWKTGGAASASPGPRRAQPGPARPEDEELDHDAIAQAARASRGKSRLPLLPGIGVAPQDPEAQPLGPRVTADGLLGWLGSEHVQSGLNAKQLELLRVVVERVLVELELVPPDHEIALRRAEPLAWLLHGPPGTGKSHVLKFLRELFEEQLGYAQGIDYEVAAFQAVNAADIRGRTLHNACGLGVDAAALDRAVSQEAAKRMSYWRWLVVDEVSMVNARLLAQVEQRLRAVVPSASQWKRGVAGESRPFAGVNVLLLGDFYQLPPPSGGYLADVPSSRRPPRLSTAADAEPDLLADYGRNLVWGGALQGVTELEERERCKDDWWNEVVDELRRGELSEENWRYLHGKPVAGCRLTAAERESRRRVIAGPGDPRLGEEKFRWAAAIVANNDAKYQINKDRAEDYSRAAESPLRWSVALDAPSAEVLQTQARGAAGEKVQGARGASLRAQECDKAARVRWLQYHDRDTENLSGMLPLAVGMRVVLADHLDRAEDKLLLRGSAGRVHSWVWKENDLRPTCVYVKFDGATWQLDGAPEPGLYPVYPARKVWKLDAKRKKPVLKIARTQLPLALAYAITAHGSQGKTLPAALVDFNVDKRTDVTFGTVAASRVRSRKDVLILRPFERWLYTRGAPEGPALLLQQLRGEEVDWEAFRETKAPSATCEKCKERKTLDYFSDRQWERVRANRSAICLACGPSKGGQKTLKRKLPSGLARLDCRGCKSRKLEDAFPRAQLQQDESEAKRAARGEASAQRQRCLNCAARGSRAKDCHSCRKCGKQWIERQAVGSGAGQSHVAGELELLRRAKIAPCAERLLAARDLEAECGGAVWRFHSVVQDGERPGRELRMYASMSWPRGALRRPAAVGAELGRQLLVDEAIDLVELASVLDPACSDFREEARGARPKDDPGATRLTAWSLVSRMRSPAALAKTLDLNSWPEKRGTKVEAERAAWCAKTACASGAELGQLVRVLLKTNKKGKTTDTEIKGLIHQANVRREVVVNLVLDMKRLGHPSFAGADEEGVRLRAAALPTDGVPPEVLKVVAQVDADFDDAEDKLQPQKAATPCDGRQEDVAAAGATFAAQRARAVVAEGCAEEDANQAAAAALKKLREELATEAELRSMEKLEVRAGNQLVDQFQPLYFAVAFCFCFPRGTACPDVRNSAARAEEEEGRRSRRERRGDGGREGSETGAPRVNIRAWAAAMQRRVEAQFRRDWTFGFAVWNYLFRTAVNLQKNAYMFSAPNADGGGYHSLQPEEIVAGAQELARRLNGTYTDVNGGEKPVRGDLTKLRFANLQPAARKILANVEARAANIPGTHEVRKTMRLQTHAYRVCYGTSIFLTFSPSERDTALMLRLARVREEDPALLRDGAKKFQARGAPALDEEFCRLSPEALAESLPNYEDRRALLARDPLACAEGFRTLVLLTLRHLLGVRFCPRCPNCAASERPCSDAFGSNALATGGVLGRVDAVFGSIECQKSGTLHAHLQVFVQCRHQRGSLAGLLDLGKPELQTLLQRYASYTAHVRRSVYCDPDGWERDRAAAEEEWPEYKDCALMLSRPAYQASRRLRPEEWTQRYLAEDVEQLQRRKQHHVHLPAGPGGERRPLAHCRDFKDPTRCKSGFPRDSQLILGRTALVCHGLAEQLDLPVKGKRSSLGLQWGPVNDPNLNGNHPALLAALETHDDALCQEEACVGDGDVKLLVRAAQAGYGCDYTNKRLPIAVHELKEWQKGQRELGEELKDKPAGYVGARVAKRLTTDCYARGVCRGAVECANLTTRAAANDPTAAESVKTATVHSISLRFGFQLLDAAAAGEAWPTEPQHLRTDLRPRARQGRVVSCPFWTFYGARGRAAQVYELCAFEFARHFRFQQAKRLLTLAPTDDAYHTALTDAGAAARQKPAGQLAARSGLRSLRGGPHVPVVQGALGGRSEVDYARCVLLLFCPWTTHPDDASAAVPYLGDLCKFGQMDWRRALRRRLILRGFPTEEVKLFALNFCFVYCLPRELRPDQHVQENSDNEVQDEPVFFDEADLEAARATHVRGAGKLGSGDAGESGEEDGEVEDEVAATRLCIMTKQMFDLSRAAWKTGGTASASPGPRRAQPGPARPKDEELDHDAIAQAARASRGKSRLPLLPGIGVAPQDPEAQPLGPRVTADGLLGWLGSEHVQSGLNAKQLELLRVVVERGLVELELVPPDHEIALRRAEPLAWLLHGPPGTGKSHVLKFLRELFEEQLGYAQGIDYEVAAFQAVNAADIRGRTLHNACGLGVDAAALDRAVSQEAAKRMSYWRWLVVDEISMVNARLLAQVEQRLRAVVPSASQWKRGVAGESRPFAGVNVLLLGDFYQLPPPSGGYLADVPSSRRPPRLSAAADAEPDLLADYGRNLVWGGALQGVTELEERERCKDDWWNEVVDELRCCRMTAAERESRRRVIAGPGDPRLGDEKFRWAAAIVANNDAKYQINKDRAEDYSHVAESPLRWSVALDAPSTEVLQTQARGGAGEKVQGARGASLRVQECDKAARVRWLQYHDRDTENLSGMLPLAVGMRVVLADHLDRAEDKLLLRGSAGRVHSWVWKENDLRPTCVYVKFDGATWQLDGAPEPGLYPVYPARKVWKLDAKRKKPVLKIARTQLPLALAYAITAHGSQGKTLPAALVDFNVDKRTDVTFGTVAASRVRSRKDVLILRPFERWLYTRGAPEGPALLLQQLRGEEVDWEAFRETKAPSATCEKCKERKTLDYFSDRQWERVRANRSAICLACGPSKGGQKTLKRKLPSGLARLDCRGCKSRKLEDAFPRAQLQQDESEAKRRCLKCLKGVHALNCSVCLGEKPLSEFNSAMATMPWAAVCGPCGKSARQQPKPGRAGWFACRTCETFLPPQGAARGEASAQRRRCLNCAARGSRAKDCHSCRKCGKQWIERQAVGANRQRRCPKCRAK